MYSSSSLANALVRATLGVEQRAAQPWLSETVDQLFALFAGRAFTGQPLPISVLHDTRPSRLYGDPPDCSDFAEECEDFDLCAGGWCGEDSIEHPGHCPGGGFEPIGPDGHYACWYEQQQVCCDCEVVTEFCPEVEGLVCQCCPPA